MTASECLSVAAASSRRVAARTKDSSASRPRYVLCLLSLALLAGCRQPPSSLRTSFGDGPIPSFTLIDSRGQAFPSDQLKGKVWVAHFFFTTCAAGCSETATTMQYLQEVFRDHPHVALVSISINPDNDVPEVLERYAKELNAKSGQWHFLTAPQSPRVGETVIGATSGVWHYVNGEGRVHDIVMKDFFQSVDRNPGNKPGFEFTHSFRLVLVDHEGNRVGYVDGKDVAARSDLVARLIELLSLRRVATLEPQRVWFPRLNASLNGLCAVLLLAGYLAIKQRKEKLHIVCMVAALAVSAVFLACYLYYHFVILDGRPTAFSGEGWVRGVYFAILLSHTLLAAAVAPMAIGVTVLGFRDKRVTHVKWARWTFPLWLYVSITGVVVYWMLYHMYPPY